MAYNIPPEISDYLGIVEQEKYPVCNEQKLLAAMIRGVFENDDIYVDVNQLARYMELQKFFPFDLYEWEKFCFSLHCCTYWSKTGLPRFPDLLLLVGRGAGKNGYLSFEDFCLLTVVNNIRGYNVDVVATTEDQAKTSFDEIREDVLDANKNYMSKYFAWTMEVIKNLKTNSKMRYYTNRAESKDGLKPGIINFDEYHQYTNNKIIDVFTTALGKKPHPRTTIATTDGKVRDGPLDDIKATAVAILKGKQSDNGLLPFICRLDKEEDAKDPQLWVKANPSLPYNETLKNEIAKAWDNCQTNPQLYSEFMTKRMNLPIGNKDIEVTTWDNILATKGPVPDMKGCSCVAGIDFARSDDFVAVGLLFKIEDTRYWITHTFVCRQSKDLPRIKAPLDEWERAGLLSYINDVEIHPSVVAAWLADKALDYNIIRLGIDQFRYSLMSNELEKLGFTARGKDKNIILVRPSNQQYEEPVINSMFINRGIMWGDNPLMRWYTNNTKKATSAHGNFSYEKIEEKSRKNDGFMALVSAKAAEGDLVSKREPPIVLGAFVF